MVYTVYFIIKPATEVLNWGTPDDVISTTLEKKKKKKKKLSESAMAVWSNIKIWILDRNSVQAVFFFINIYNEIVK